MTPSHSSRASYNRPADVSAIARFEMCLDEIRLVFQASLNFWMASGACPCCSEISPKALSASG